MSDGSRMSKVEIGQLRRWMLLPMAVVGIFAVIVSRVMQDSPMSKWRASTPTPTAAVASASPMPATSGLVTSSSTSAPGTPDVPPLPAPRPLPASNSFTTLDDYRQRRVAAPHPPEPLTPLPAGRTPDTELGRVTMQVRDYRAAYGANPVGNNREIVRTLLGENPRGTRFLDPSTVSLNERGELLDAWGHPYFFHALSGTAMEIRSAGPDGKPYTADDLVR